MRSNGDRAIVAVPPGVEIPPIEAKADPIQRAIGRMEMLRVALEAYFYGAFDGINEYPRARSIDDLANLLERQDLLAADWTPSGAVLEFELTRYRYRIAVRAGGQKIGISSPPPTNPYRMLLVLPHLP